MPPVIQDDYIINIEEKEEEVINKEIVNARDKL
jgi:hypothetical protein